MVDVLLIYEGSMGAGQLKSALNSNRSLRGGGQRVGSGGHSGQAKKNGESLDHCFKFLLIFGSVFTRVSGRRYIKLFFQNVKRIFEKKMGFLHIFSNNIFYRHQHSIVGMI